MGGDGGTCASNRRYMRGAGTADHTADSKRASASELAEAERDRLRQAMTTCAVSGAVLDFCPGEGGTSRADVVACPYGRLYMREAAVEALLRRRERQQCEEESEIGWHVRGLKDLHPARFHTTETSSEAADGTGGRDKKGGGAAAVRYVPTCPITGVELTGTVPAYLVVRKKDKKKSKKTAAGAVDDEIERDALPNVLSERAVREMGVPGLQVEYGPFEEEDLIRLAPPMVGGVFDKIKAKLERRREEERASKKSKKEDKKRKKKGENGGKADGTNGEKKRPALPATVSVGKKLKPNGGGEVSAAEAARSSVAAAVASNPVLSSLFSNGRTVSEKEKKDNLFAR